MNEEKEEEKEFIFNDRVIDFGGILVDLNLTNKIIEEELPKISFTSFSAIKIDTINRPPKSRLRQIDKQNLTKEQRIHRKVMRRGY